MLIKVEARTRQGTQLNLPLGDVTNGLAVQSIEGLDPVKATLISSVFAQQDGEQYHSSRREKRNIRLTLGFVPDWTTNTVESLRSRVYNYFMPKSEITLRFLMDDGRFYDISGRVESLETPLFSRDPSVVISILCFNPDFYDPTVFKITGQTTNLTTGYTEHSIQYSGTVESGIIFRLDANRTASQITIYHVTPAGDTRTLDFVTPMVAGNTVVINTNPGEKAATLLSSNSTRSVLYGVSPTASWIAIQPGMNRLRVYATGLPMPYDFSYTTKYGGL